MKRNRLVWLSCVFGILFLFGCGSGDVLPPDKTIKGDLAIEKDFYLRNKPEPVHISYSVWVEDIGAETALEVIEEENETIHEEVNVEIEEDIAEDVNENVSDETLEDVADNVDEDINDETAEEAVEEETEESDVDTVAGCEMIVDIRLDLYRFDTTTNNFVLEETLAEENNIEIDCYQSYEGTASWSYDKKASPTTYKVMAEITLAEAGNGEDYPAISEVFVIWKSSGSPKGHARRDLKKIDQVEKLLTKLQAYYEVYLSLWDGFFITGEEEVKIQGQVMTLDEAVEMATNLWGQAVSENTMAIEYFNTQDYETSFIKAKAAERYAHDALKIYHALLAQATRGSGQGE